jgi:hypothetical protein
MRSVPQALAIGAVVVQCGIAAAAAAAELPPNDYPTVARANYVFGCMQVNGRTRDALERQAETVMRVRQRGGRNASMFLTMPMLRAKVDVLKRAQVEAELRCF